MARNPVQFQKGISLNAFLSLYLHVVMGFFCPAYGFSLATNMRLVSGSMRLRHKLMQVMWSATASTRF